MANFLIAFFCVCSLYAEDLGTFGVVFPIQEEDLLIVLQKRLEAATQDPHARKTIENKFIASIEAPKGIDLPRARNPRSYEFDPSMTLNADLNDHEGKLFFKKGSAVNPLEHYSMHQNLLFFDGSDPKQIAWAKEQSGIWILTKGRPLDIERKEVRPVYFDQAGFLLDKMNIRALPVRVTQKGLRLQVEEIPCF
jgi:conjugal transfer pilus assembly protein TraW